MVPRQGVKRVRADTFGYLQRSFPGIASWQDQDEARGAGWCAVHGSLHEKETGVFSGTIGIERKKTKKYGVNFVCRPIADAAKYTRSVPKEYIAKNGHDVTQAFVDYAKPIVGELPECEVF